MSNVLFTRRLIMYQQYLYLVSRHYIVSLVRIEYYFHIIDNNYFNKPILIIV